MNKPHYSMFNMLIQKMVASRPGSWFFSRTEHHFDWFFLKLSGNRVSMTGIFAGLPVLELTTTGAKSGQTRTLPLIFIRDTQNPKEFALIATNWGQAHNPAWYYNLKADPHATCNLRGQTDAYLAREAVDAEYERYWQLAQGAYLGFPLYKARASHRRIPIMVLSPQREEAG